MQSREMTEAIAAFKARRASREGAIPASLADIRAHLRLLASCIQYRVTLRFPQL